MQGWNDWSGAVGKLASQSSCAGETVPRLARRERVRRLRLSPTKRWRRLGEAKGKMLKTEILKAEILLVLRTN